MKDTMTRKELSEAFRIITENLVNAMRQHSKQLKGFWYLDKGEYELLHLLVEREKGKLDNTPLRDRLVVLQEKIDYILGNGLCNPYCEWIYKK